MMEKGEIIAYAKLGASIRDIARRVRRFRSKEVILAGASLNRAVAKKRNRRPKLNDRQMRLVPHAAYTGRHSVWQL